MAWAVLFTAGLLEIGWAIGLKYAEGFTRPVPSVLTLASMIGSIVLLGLALKSLPVGTGYAVWTGIGTVGTALLAHRFIRRACNGAAAYLHRVDSVRHRRAETGDVSAPLARFTAAAAAPPSTSAPR